MIIFQRIIRNKATISVVLLPTIVAFTISIYLSIQPCSLSSKVGSIVQFICLIMPCLAQVCERLRSHTTDLPWQTKSTFIIVLFLLVCSEILCFSDIPEIINKLLFARQLPVNDKNSSKIKNRTIPVST